VHRAARDRLWRFAHEERSALAQDLASLTPERWRQPTLCQGWDVEEVVAHLTAAASLGSGAWLRSMVRARFNPDVHNRRQLEAHRGRTPAETLQRFGTIIDSTTAPSLHTAAYVGEVLVHAQDVRQPLGLTGSPSVGALSSVADFYVQRDFTVNGRSLSAGLALRADDGPFSAGEGPAVVGPTLTLVMAMAGRAVYLDHLHGSGLPILRERLLADLPTQEHGSTPSR
jgi:uncharacterized protein (TIGR03083 family)